MADSNSSVELDNTENSHIVIDKKNGAINRFSSLRGKISKALRFSTPREILEAVADQAVFEEKEVEKVLPAQERKAVEALRVSANYLWEQKTIFGLMALYPTLELVQRFSGLQLDKIPLEVVKHGTTGAIGTMMVSSGEGSFSSRLVNKSKGALGFSAGVATMEHLTGLPGSFIAAVDEPAIFAGKRGLEKVKPLVQSITKKIREAKRNNLSKSNSNSVSGKIPAAEQIEI